MFKITIPAQAIRNALEAGFDHHGYGSVKVTGFGPDVGREHDVDTGAWPRRCTDPLHGGAVFVVDRYGDGKEGKIDAETLQRGLDLLAEKHPRALAALLQDQADVVVGDLLIQAAAFGEVIYG